MTFDPDLHLKDLTGDLERREAASRIPEIRVFRVFRALDSDLRGGVLFKAITETWC